jgi:hypothetical protein
VLAISYIVITFLSGHTTPLKSEAPNSLDHSRGDMDRILRNPLPPGRPMG